jgi:hypothetical protein
MGGLLFASKLGAKVFCGAGLLKAAPFVVPIACAVVCVGATIAGEKYLSKKLSEKELADAALHPCDYFDDDYADEDGISDDKGIGETE